MSDFSVTLELPHPPATLFRFLAEYRMVIYGALLVGLMVFRPQGLLGGINLGLTRRPI